MKGFIDTHASIVALLIDTGVDRLVNTDATSFDAVIHVFVAFVQNSLARADARLDLRRPCTLAR